MALHVVCLYNKRKKKSYLLQKISEYQITLAVAISAYKIRQF